MTKMKKTETKAPTTTTTAPTPRPPRPAIDFAKRQANRALPAKEVLRLMRADAPDLYDRAEVVGTWIWVHFDTKQPPTVTRLLAELGFHWNNTRQTWQHPCGPVTTPPSPDDPREKYGTYRPADRAA